MLCLFYLIYCARVWIDGPVYTFTQREKNKLNILKERGYKLLNLKYMQIYVKTKNSHHKIS